MKSGKQNYNSDIDNSSKSELEKHFDVFRKNIIGIDTTFESPEGTKKIIYADWVASGRLYKTIEDKLSDTFGPYVANTHTETNETGTKMTLSYKLAHNIIKKHVNASSSDVIITYGSGMTSVINKLQRILSLKGCENLMLNDCLKEEEKPVVFITHMEHHSNHTSWLETIADVIQIAPDSELLVDIDDLKTKLEKYKNRKFKIGAFTACSNVTGIITPYAKMSKLMHEHGGLCFIDFAASAPYVEIDMHPKDPLEKLDAIYFSPHKFLGGPGSSGVLVFNSSLYSKKVPDNSGGGTVEWTNPWGEYKYIDDIEIREDGGTPGFLQAIKSALCIELKNKLDLAKIKAREEELVKIIFEKFKKIPQINILAGNTEKRLPIFSFYLDDLHYNLFVKLLNDYFGVQMRGGCVCAGTYGHILLNVDYKLSKEITDKINRGDLSEKPGWVRMSLHPTTTNKELDFIMDSISQVVDNHKIWGENYKYCSAKNEYYRKNKTAPVPNDVKQWFEL